ncbi:hypothetical protein [Polaromonas sp.]|uniref:hypothetical protein n=1 Tax=Polaromonas sp. TaxID=1869339 RepID=UPI002FC67D56
MKNHASTHRLFRTALSFIVLATTVGVAQAQVQVRLIQGFSGCKDAVVTNMSGRRLDVTLKYIYQGRDGNYPDLKANSNSSTRLGPMAHGEQKTVSLSQVSVSCRHPYSVETDVVYTDLDAVRRQQEAQAAREQQREREAQMALARRIDENNRRAAEARRQEQLKHQQMMDERARQRMAAEQAAIARRQQVGTCPRNVSC